MPRSILALGSAAATGRPGSAGRVLAAWLSALTVDVAAFSVARHVGVSAADAHAIAFGLAALAGLGVLRWTSLTAQADAAARAAPRAPRIAELALVLPVAFAVHGAVLTLGIEAAALAPTLAIALAALVAALLAAAGFGLLGAALRTGVDPARRWTLAALFALPAIFLLRALYQAVFELTPQEAYYWQFAQHLATGYLDHPPLVAWLIAATTWAASSEFAVRLPALASAALTVLFAGLLARDLAGPAAGWRAALLAALLPYFFLAGFMMTPDAPLAAAWAAALFALNRALTRGSLGAWLGVGVAVGFGALAKYSMLLLPIAALVLLLVERRALAVLRTPGPWLAGGVALLLFAPVLVWNAQHGWASFAFQGPQRLAPQAARFDTPVFLAAIALLLTPWGVAALVRGWWRARAASTAVDAPGPAAARFALVFTLVPLAPFALASGWSESKFHWTGPIWLAALPLVACTLLPPAPGHGRWIDRHLARSWPVVLGVLAFVYALPLLHHGALGTLGVHHHHRYVETGWRDLRLQVQAIEDAVTRESGRRPAVIGLDRHDTASLLAFYDPHGDGAADTSSRHIVFDAPALMYGFWHRPGDFAGRDLVAVACHRHLIDDPRLAAQARRIGPVLELAVHKRGVHTRDCFARVLYGFRPARR